MSKNKDSEMSDYPRSRARSRSPLSYHDSYRSKYMRDYDRDFSTYNPIGYSRKLWIDEYYRKKERDLQTRFKDSSQFDHFKKKVYSNHIIGINKNDKLEPSRIYRCEEYVNSKDRQKEPRSRVQNNRDITKVNLENTLDIPKKDDEFNINTALRMSLKENKDVECNVIDITDDDDVIFVNDSRTSPPEVITIVDNEKEDLNINVISVCRQLIVLEEFLYEEILAVRSLFNQALSLERTNLNSSTLLLTHTNLKFLGSLMEKLKDDVVSGIIPIIRISLVKKLTNDIIYLVENTEEIVEQVNKEVVKEIEQKKTPTVEVQSTSAIKPPTIEEQSTSVVKHPIIKEQSTSADKPPKIEKQSTSVVKLPTNEEQSTSVAKAPIDISKYDNKRMKIAVDIGKALLANGKKIITPEELDALVNVYLVVTAEMSDSESDDD